MSGDVALTAALRTNLNSLQRTSGLIDQTSQRLSTGKEVNSVFDDPVNFSRAQSFTDRAGDLDRVLDNISQSKRTVEQAQSGAEAVESLLDSARSLVDQAAEEIGQGSGGNASITGDADLRDVDFGGTFNTGDKLTFEFNDGDGGTASFQTSDISDFSDVEQLVAEIDAQDNLNAELGSGGELSVSSVNSGPLRTIVNGSNERDAISALGLDNVIAEENDGSGGTTFASTTTSGTTLTSFQLFTDSATNDVAEASSELNGLESEDGTVAIQASANNEIKFDIQSSDGSSLNETTIDGKAGGDTIQDLVDSLNSGASGNLVRASFDGDSGKLNITAIDSNVDRLTAEVQTSDATTTDKFNIGLTGSNTPVGTADVNLTDGANDGNPIQQAIRFGETAGKLGQIEDSFNEVRNQIDSAVGEAQLAGTNLLQGDSLQTFFDTQRTESLTTQGVNFTSGGLGLEEANFASQSNIDASRNSVIEARNDVRAFSSRITTDLNVIQTRESLAENTQETLTSASDDLTLADQNEEAAKLSALQTRQQLANTSLSIAVQSQQSVLQILR